MSGPGDMFFPAEPHERSTEAERRLYQQFARTLAAVVHAAGGELIVSRSDMDGLDCRLEVERLPDGSGVVYQTRPRGGDW